MASSRLLRAGGGPDLRRYQLGMRPPWYDVLVQAELARGDLVAAIGWADRSAALAPVFGAAEAHALSRARILVAAGTRDGARETVAMAGRVADHYREVGMRVVEGEVRQVLAAALAASGDHGRAQADAEPGGKSRGVHAGAGYPTRPRTERPRQPCPRR